MNLNNYKNWRLALDANILRLTLDRGDNHNNLTADTLLELKDICDWIVAHPKKVRAVIVAGQGKHFSTGVDVHFIHSALGQNKNDFGDGLRRAQACLDAFEALPVPTIAQISGFCIGGGLILALCCDFRLCSPDSIFLLPEVKRGIAVIMGTHRLSRVVGVARAKQMILLAQKHGARQAFEWGLVHKLVEREKLEDEAIQWATRLLAAPRQALAISKQIVDEGFLLGTRDSQELEIKLQASLLDSHDMREGVESFLEGRKPNFRGD